MRANSIKVGMSIPVESGLGIIVVDVEVGMNMGIGVERSIVVGPAVTMIL